MYGTSPLCSPSEAAACQESSDNSFPKPPLATAQRMERADKQSLNGPSMEQVSPAVMEAMAKPCLPRGHHFMGPVNEGGRKLQLEAMLERQRS